MKKILTLLIAFCAVTAVSAQLRTLKPVDIFLVTDANLDAVDYRIMDFQDKYDVSVVGISASSYLNPQGSNTYYPSCVADCDCRTGWTEGVAGYGIGQYIKYEFDMRSPRFTTVYILNGYGKNNKSWNANSRVKKLKVYHNDRPIAILELQDSRSVQAFDLGLIGRIGNGPTWSIKFEILEVYPGTQYQDTVISEIYFGVADRR